MLDWARAISWWKPYHGTSLTSPRRRGRTHITAYTCRYLDEGHHAEYLGEVEAARARYFQEDRVLNMASSQWEVMANRLEPGPEG